MYGLTEWLDQQVNADSLPGAVGIIARGDDVEIACAGTQEVGGDVPMTPDSIFRLASLTKPIVAATALTLIQDGLMTFDDPVIRWVPELSEPVVLRTPASAVDDVVPVTRRVTVEDLLSSRCGWGWPSDFSLPGVEALAGVQRDGRPQSFPAADQWLAELARVPMLHQPGAGWLYDTSYTLLGILITRVTDQPLRDVIAERICQPLGMTDTTFVVPREKLDRFTTAYAPTESGGLVVTDETSGEWSRQPALEIGNGGLAGTAGDWLRFAQMLDAAGRFGGRQVLAPELVQAMTSDQLDADQRNMGQLFLDGQGWGYGGSVDIDHSDAWTIPGRYGWVGGTGTTGHLIPSTRTVAILLTQVDMTGPQPLPWMEGFWTFAAEV